MREQVAGKWQRRAAAAGGSGGGRQPAPKPRSARVLCLPCVLAAAGGARRCGRAGPPQGQRREPWRAVGTRTPAAIATAEAIMLSTVGDRRYRGPGLQKSKSAWGLQLPGVSSTATNKQTDAASAWENAGAEMLLGPTIGRHRGDGRSLGTFSVGIEPPSCRHLP